MGSLGITREQRGTVAVLLFGAVLVVLNQTMLTPALPSIMEHMGVDATTVQWLTSAYSMVEAVMIPLSAWFLGRFRVRRLFCALMLLFCVGSVVAVAAPVFAVLLLGRVIQACATGVIMVAVMSIILLTFPREARGMAMGLVGLVISFAPAVGPALGGLLVDAVGWRALFCISAVLGIAVTAAAAFKLPDENRFPQGQFDALSVALSTVGLVALLYGLSSFASSGMPLLCAALIVAGIAVLGLFVRRQTKLTEPLLRIEVLKSRRYRSSVLVMALLQALLIGLGVLMPLYVQNVLGYSATISGLVILPGALASAACSMLGGRIYDKSGVRGVALIAAALMFVGAVGMCLYAQESSLVLVIIANLVFCADLQMLFTPVNTWGVNSLENRLVQHATAVTNTMNQVGASVGTALIMSFAALGSSWAVNASGIAKSYAGYHVSYLLIAAISALVLVLVAALVRDRAGEQGKALAKRSVNDATSIAVRDCMDTQVASVPANATLGTAVKAITEGDASGVVLLGADKRIVGFLSNGDVLRLFSSAAVSVTDAGTGITLVSALEDEDLRVQFTRLSGRAALDFATKKVVCIDPDESLADACRMLCEKRLKMVPVAEDGKLVGAVRRSSLMHLLDDMLE